MSPTPAPQELDFDQLVVERAGLTLHSAFQPIVSVAHCRVVGHEALLRGRGDDDDRPLSPAELFPKLVAEMPSVEVHETCSRLHLASFQAQKRNGWLFINANPTAMDDRQKVAERFGGWLRDAGVEPHSVVVEIIETRVHDERSLAEAVNGFRDVGCLVAIDDFGAGESNFERIWRLKPDIVKIDRAMITEASDDPLVRRLLPGIVSLLHEAGCLVVMEGIETEDQALICLESGADFVQGFYFSRPSRGPASSGAIFKRFAELSRYQKSADAHRASSDQGILASFAGALHASVAALEDGLEIADACSTFLAVAGVQRMYLLDEDGYQIGKNVESSDMNAADPRFAPCADAEGSSWAQRPYFKRAMHSPGSVQISRPYLSVRDARTCITVSLAFEFETQRRVLCADLDQEQVEPLSVSREADSLCPEPPRESGFRFR